MRPTFSHFLTQVHTDGAPNIGKKGSNAEKKVEIITACSRAKAVMVIMNNYVSGVRPPTPVPKFILSDTTASVKPPKDDSREPTELSNNLDEGVLELKRTLGDSHPDVAFSINVIGDACMANGDFEEALNYLSQALAIKRECFCENHPSISNTLYSIGSVNVQLSILSEGMENFKEALRIYRHAFVNRKWMKDNKDPKFEAPNYYLLHMTSLVLTSIGGIEFAREEYNSAMDYYLEALDQAQQAAVNACEEEKKTGVSGKSIVKEARLSVANILSDMASVCAEKGERVEAIKHYNSALAIQIRELGEDDPAVACTLHNIGTMNYRAGNLHLSLKSYKQVLKMRRLLFGFDHQSVVNTLLTIAMVHEKANEIDKAESALFAALKINARVHGEVSVPVANVTEKLGSIQARNGREEAAYENYLEAQTLYKAKLKSSHPHLRSISDKISYIRNKDQSDLSLFMAQASELFNAFLEDGCSATLCVQREQVSDKYPAPKSANSFNSSTPVLV